MDLSIAAINGSISFPPPVEHPVGLPHQKRAAAVSLRLLRCSSWRKKIVF